MTAQLLDGKATAAAICRELAERVAKLTANGGRPPGLGTVLVGDDPGSRAYRHGLVGDIHPDTAQVAGWLAPMPGGRGTHDAGHAARQRRRGRREKREHRMNALNGDIR